MDDLAFHKQIEKFIRINLPPPLPFYRLHDNYAWCPSTLTLPSKGHHQFVTRIGCRRGRAYVPCQRELYAVLLDHIYHG